MKPEALHPLNALKRVVGQPLCRPPCLFCHLPSALFSGGASYVSLAVAHGFAMAQSPQGYNMCRLSEELGFIDG